ncbi:replication factor C subunit 4 [Malassezia sp. CBS 17886]|nr:replication factor C subunit 4 [Malassezia sp. CBS 17886]
MIWARCAFFLLCAARVLADVGPYDDMRAQLAAHRGRLRRGSALETPWTPDDFEDDEPWLDDASAPQKTPSHVHASTADASEGDASQSAWLEDPGLVLSWDFLTAPMQLVALVVQIPVRLVQMLINTASAAVALLGRALVVAVAVPWHYLCAAWFSTYVSTSHILAPASYVIRAVYVVLVAWPLHAISSAASSLRNVYIVTGVAVILGGFIGACATLALFVENLVYRRRRSDRSGGIRSSARRPDAWSMSTSQVGKYELPWCGRVEKYRPRYLRDVVGNAATIDRLRVIEENGNCPHLLVSGLPGIGKTTSVHCLAHALLGDAYKEAVLELNASDDRGIDVVRNKIKVFAQKKVSLPPGKHKIIILDEADSMTPGAQQALRRTMEIFSNTTRFCFACNQSNKVIEPIQSRCAILRFARIQDEELLRRLVEICRAEKVEYTDEGLAAVVFTAEGDMRQAVNNLQSTWTGQGLVTPDNVFNVCDQPHPLLIRDLLMRCEKGDVDGALDKLDEVWSLGYSALDIVTTLFRVVKTMDSLSEATKLEFIREIGWTHMRTLEGVGTLLQLSGLVARLAKQALDPSLFAL